MYRQAADRMAKAAALCPEGNPDRAVLAKHAGEAWGEVVQPATFCALGFLAFLQVFVEFWSSLLFANLFLCLLKYSGIINRCLNINL